MTRSDQASRHDTRIRVFVLINSLAPYGAEHFVLNHARFADRSKFELVVAHLGGTTALGVKFRELGVEIVDLTNGASRRFTPQTAMRLVLELRRRRIDILQTHIALSGVFGSVLGKAARVPAIVVTEQTTRSSHPPWMRRASDLSFRFADRHVYISRAVADDFAAVHPSAAATDRCIITNGIDTQEIARLASASRAAVRAELGLTPTDFAFLNVGRLAEQKGQTFAISALARARVRHPKASLWIAGAGDLRQTLEAQARELGVSEGVHFLGQRMDVHRLLGGFDGYVHPALFEGLGIAVLEAMAAGLPVVASAVDAIPEYVKDLETGLLAPVRDIDRLAGAMGRLLDDSALASRLGRAGHDRVARDHDIRAAVRDYEELYTSLVVSRR